MSNDKRVSRVVFDPAVFTTRPDEFLICSICHGVMQEPVLCGNGDSFCRFCITKHLAEAQSCPICSCTLHEGQLVPNKCLHGFIRQMDIRCPFTQYRGENLPEHDDFPVIHEAEEPSKVDSDGEGSWDKLSPDSPRSLPSQTSVRPSLRPELCAWTGKVADFDAHCSVCEFNEEPAKCPNEGCDAFILNRQRADHLQECTHRQVPCAHCTAIFVYHQLEAHEEACPERIVPCPNSCCSSGEVVAIKQKDIPPHLEQCPLKPIDCRYKGIGCTVKLPRNDMAAHEQDATLHLDLAVRELDQVKKLTLERLKAQETSFQSQIKALTTDISKIRVAMDNCDEGIERVKNVCCDSEDFTWKMNLTDIADTRAKSEPSDPVDAKCFDINVRCYEVSKKGAKRFEIEISAHEGQHRLGKTFSYKIHIGQIDQVGTRRCMTIHGDTSTASTELKNHMIQRLPDKWNGWRVFVMVDPSRMNKGRLADDEGWFFIEASVYAMKER